MSALAPVATMRPPRSAPRWALPAAALALGCASAGFATVATLRSPDRPAGAVTALHVVGGLTFLVTGVLAWVNRPHNRVGLIMTVAGLGWFVTDLTRAPSSVAYTIGDLFGVVFFGCVAHLIVSFPTGRLENAGDRAVVLATYVWATLGNFLPGVLLAAPARSCDCAVELLAVHRDLHLHQVANAAQQAVNVTFALVVFGTVVLHRRRATAPARRAMAPALWASGPILVLLVALNITSLAISPWWLEAALPALTPVALASLPVSFLAGLLRSRLSTLAVGHLVVELGARPPTDGLRDALARTLGDPSLVLAYCVPGREGWVDDEGHPMDLPGPSSRQSYTILERDGEPVAALVHDRSLENDPALVSAVAAAASLAIENERLHADARARLAEVRESRARLVAVADAERRRLERDLHDGAQQSLVALALSLTTLRDRLDSGRIAEVHGAVAAAEDQLRQALNELRELASGIRPAILTDAGLAAALETLSERVPLPVTMRVSLDGRLPDAVEAAAYFAVCEALVNVAKHARARTVIVDVSARGDRLLVTVTDDGIGGASLAGGSGLRGLVDRIAALDGVFRVDSPPGAGTRLSFELPCG